MFFARWRMKRKELKAAAKNLKAAWKEADQHLRDGKKVNAIKAVRQHTGLGLKEAKVLVDNRYANQEYLA